MNGTITCCKGCTKRYVGCHGSCEEYNAQKKRHDDVNEVAKKDTRNTIVLIGLKRDFAKSVKAGVYRKNRHI